MTVPGAAYTFTKRCFQRRNQKTAGFCESNSDTSVVKTFLFQSAEKEMYAKMTVGACYIRVSTEEQTEFSPDAQLRVLKEYAKKNDIMLTKKHIYIDEGISGRKAEKRPAFMQMVLVYKCGQEKSNNLYY